ncbi:GntR family transcriptional regulator [Lacrimispora indolis]|uniref:GntR family transcriptional regulator n=1 Tax=Lacrimispora indolis TaxID=69825 RepID=UPI00040093C3|nr:MULTISPECIES: GntR family transcriptional regulator [Lachnospiraceae]MBE7722530.1 GntR family transcriptional regulator [Lacrimispora celerecrescens]
MDEKIMLNSTDTTGNMIAQEIRKGISEGRYKTGEKIKEADLCQRFGVSRTPVREAFRLLQNEGLLVHNPQRGVQVPEFRLEELMNLQQMRTTLECLSARNAAPLANEENIWRLRELNRQISEFDENNTHKTDALDREFHLTIARIGSNPYVTDFLQNILTRYELSTYVIPFQGSRIPYTYKEHEDVITALELNDAELAEKYMSIHFHYSTLSLSKKLARYMEEIKQKKRKKRN